MNPANVNPGSERISGTIIGANIHDVLSLNLGDGVVVHNFNKNSSTEVYVNFSVPRETNPGPRRIYIQTSAGLALSEKAFSVGDNRLPRANLRISPPAGIKATNFTFDASASDDLDGQIVTYEWRLGDGRVRTGKRFNYKYDRPGVFNVTLVVTDNRGGSHTSFEYLYVDASKRPFARFTVSPDTGDTDTTFRFDGSASRDPDGNVVQWIWSFGDGYSASGKAVEHKFGSAANWNVSLVVVDNTRMDNYEIHSHFVRDAPDPGPEPPPPSGEEEDCTQAARNSGLIFGTVVDVQGFDAIVQLPAGSTCQNSFYRCGDMRRADPEQFRGIIMGMEDLGNGTFSVFNDCPFDWPPDIGETVFLYYKRCDENFCQ